ncbi:MAG: RAMP superfamily CRISPR-associated protein [Deltaproteobacteria bacterium]|nr:RAMP superfamily CRISPR-associated protein [Deltaproteobacteria bacterium]
MTVQATIKLNLDICGPFLCSGTAPASWGFDATFDRNYCGRPYIDRSHIKGKLREAVEELETLSIAEWFGKKGPMENGRLFFTDLRLEDKVLEKALTNRPVTKSITRIQKDNEKRVVKPNAMQVMENAFPGGSDLQKDNKTWIEKSYTWQGEITFIAADDIEAENISKEIRIGLKAIASFGAEKGIGFGRLKTVETTLTTEAITLQKPSSTTPESQLTLMIKAEDPLLLGDIRIKESNYQESMEYITGNAIKGALAQALNMACGIDSPSSTFIGDNKTVNDAFPNLMKYFSDIRITHAYPALAREEKRPVVIPCSVVIAEGKHYDVALKGDAFLPGGNLPAFQADWKDSDYPSGFGWASPLRFAKTRTAIDDVSRRADDGSMFVYQYVCPKDGNLNDILWIGGVYLDDIPENDLHVLRGELECAIGLLKYLGKRAGRVTASLKSGVPVPFKTIKPLQVSGTAVIVLQSDTMMVNPDDLLKNGQTPQTLFNFYKSYWNKISVGACDLSHFFATQKIRGNFIKREKDKSSSYYPYYLTEAGSVFVLKVKDKDKAENLFSQWDKKGLDVPAWAETKYGIPVWKKCPYVPENGFGEVMINADLGLGKLEEGGAKL